MYYPFGEMVREFRKRQGLTQEALCDGICSAATLSKIENGCQIPKRKVSEALLERLGLMEWNTSQLIGQNEMERYELERQLYRRIKEGELDQIETMLEKLEDSLEPENLLGMQQVLFLEVLYHEKCGVPTKTLYEELIYALKYTNVYFPHVFDKEERLYTLTELEMLKDIAICEIREGNDTQAIELLEKLKNYLAKRKLSKVYCVMYSGVGEMLTERLLKKERYQAAAEICEEVISNCFQTGNFQLLAVLMKNHAYACAKLGIEDMSRKSAYYAELFCEIIQLDQSLWCRKETASEMS